MKLFHGINFLSTPPHWYFNEHRHTGIEIVGVLEGQVTLAVDEDQWQCTAGQIFVIPPFLPHRWFSEVDARLAIMHVNEAPRDLADRLLPRNGPRIINLHTQQFSDYKSLFERLEAFGDQVPSRQLRLLRAYLEAFLLTLVENSQDIEPDTAAIHEVAAYLQTHLGKPLTIAHIAEEFYMSEVTLRRRFRRIFGTSPKQYLLHLRLAEAQHLLVTSQLTIQEVAHQLGFFDIAHFSSTFRKHFGLSPSDWRKSAPR